MIAMRRAGASSALSARHFSMLETELCPYSWRVLAGAQDRTCRLVPKTLG